MQGRLRLLLVGAVIGAAGLLAAAAQPGSVQPPPSIKAAGQIRYCSDISYPPQEFYKGATPLGSDIDIGTEIARRLGVKAVFRNTAYARIISTLRARKCDAIISGMPDTLLRRKTVAFVDYLHVGQSLMVNKGNPQHIATLADLAGKRVSVEARTTNPCFLAAESRKLQKAGKKPIAIVAFPKDAQAAVALQAGKVDAYFGDSTGVAYYIIQEPSFAFAGRPIHALRVGIAFLKGDPLRLAVQKTVDSMYSDGTMRRILAKWKMDPLALT